MSKTEHLEAAIDECRKYGAELVRIEVCKAKIKTYIQINNSNQLFILSKTPSDWNVCNRVRRECRHVIAKLKNCTINDLKEIKNG